MNAPVHQSHNKRNGHTKFQRRPHQPDIGKINDKKIIANARKRFT